MDFPASQGQKVSLRVAVTLECACVCCQMRIQAGGCPGFLPDAAGTAEIGEVSGSLATAFLLSLVSQSWSSKLSPTPPHSHSPTPAQLPTALGVFSNRTGRWRLELQVLCLSFEPGNWHLYREGSSYRKGEPRSHGYLPVSPLASPGPEPGTRVLLR